MEGLMKLEFSEKIRQRREFLGMSVEELGAKIGVGAPYIELLEKGQRIPKEDIAIRLAQALQEPSDEYIRWSQERYHQEGTAIPSTPRYPEGREALIELCEDPSSARQIFSNAAMSPLEAALYGLLIDRMSHKIGDLGFWGFTSPQKHSQSTSDERLLLESFFEMLTHPEGNISDYTKVFKGLISSWRYQAPHRVIVTNLDGSTTSYRLAFVDQEGSIIPALEPEDPFYALYKMLTKEQRATIAGIAKVLFQKEERLEIQAALNALTNWHKLDSKN